MKLLEVKNIFLESFQLAQKEFLRGNSADEVQTYLDRFRSLAKLNKLKGDENDINYWRKKGFKAFQAYVIDKESTQTTSQIKKGKNPGEGVTLIDEEEYKVIVPTDFACSRHNGKDTDWCTTKPKTSHFSNYVYGGGVTLIYVINKKTQDKQAIAYVENDGEQHELMGQGGAEIYEWKYGMYELFAKDDEHLTPTEFEELNGFEPEYLINMAEKQHEAINQKLTKGQKNDIKYQFQQSWYKWSAGGSPYHREPELEKLMKAGAHDDHSLLQIYVTNVPEPPHDLLKMACRTASEAASVANDYGKPLGTEIENIFVKDKGGAAGANIYAKRILKKTWLEHGRPDIHNIVLNDRHQGPTYKQFFGITE